MAIHYATGTAADGHAALRAVGTFATGTLGWAEDHWSTNGTNSRLHLHSGTMHWSLYAQLTSTGSCGGASPLGWHVRLATDYSAAAAWDAQPGISTAADFSNTVGSGADLTWHAYGGSGAAGDYLHFVLEAGAGVVATIHLGVLSPQWIGGANGGQFAAANAQHYPSAPRAPFQPHAYSFGGALVRADIDGAAAPNYRQLTYPGDKAYGAHTVRWVGQSAASATTPLWPIYIILNRPDNYRSVAGVVPGLRECRLDLLSPGAELTLGSDVWQVWPAVKRGPASLVTSCADSGWLGVAYRKS
jgi:hypothetical protein